MCSQRLESYESVEYQSHHLFLSRLKPASSKAIKVAAIETLAHIQKPVFEVVKPNHDASRLKPASSKAIEAAAIETLAHIQKPVVLCSLERETKKVDISEIEH